MGRRSNDQPPRVRRGARACHPRSRTHSHRGCSPRQSVARDSFVRPLWAFREPDYGTAVDARGQCLSVVPELERWGRDPVRRPAPTEFPTPSAAYALPPTSENGEVQLEQLPIPFVGSTTRSRIENFLRTTASLADASAILAPASATFCVQPAASGLSVSVAHRSGRIARASQR